MYLDRRARPHSEKDGAPKEARIAYCKEAKAHRRSNETEGIQYGNLARLKGLTAPRSA
jgi:hypothetical protein